MIFLWILLWILIAILLLLFLVLFLPFSVKLSYDTEFSAKIYFCKIRIFSTDKSKKASKKENKHKFKDKQKQPKEKKKNIFLEAKDKLGFKGAVHYFGEIAKVLLDKLKWALKHIKFKDFRLNVTIASDNAANTAIRYGTVCSVAYPLLSFLFNVSDCKAKAVDISADFDEKKCKFGFSVVIRAKLIFMLVAALKILLQYKKIRDVSFDE